MSIYMKSQHLNSKFILRGLVTYSSFYIPLIFLFSRAINHEKIYLYIKKI